MNCYKIFGKKEKKESAMKDIVVEEINPPSVMKSDDMIMHA